MFFKWNRGPKEYFPVIITNLHERVQGADLIDFFRGFQKGAEIELIEKRGVDGAQRRFGQVLFSSERQAQKAIKKLDGKHLLGKEVRVREYVSRNYGNERRALGWRNSQPSGAERQERRLVEEAKPIDDFDRWLKESEEEEVAKQSAAEMMDPFGNVRKL